MQDPKYMIVGGILYHRQGNYPIPANEPVMILRGKDPVAIAAIEAYIAAHTCEDHKDSAHERLMSFRDYQREHPERVNTDCMK